LNGRIFERCGRISAIAVIDAAAIIIAVATLAFPLRILGF